MNKREKFFNDIRGLNLNNLSGKEIILVYEGVKPSCRIYVSDSSLKKLKDFCKKTGLFLESSHFKLFGSSDKGKGGFSDRRKRVPLNHRGLICYYISKTKKQTEKAKRYEDIGNHKEFGKILGYPDCCIKSFKTKSLENKKYGFVFRVLKETREEPPYSFYNNFISQYFGFSLLSHFPCSLNCKKSTRLAEKYFRALKKYSKRWAQELVRYQKSAILFTEYRGIFLIEKFGFKNKILTYDNSKIKSTLRNKIFKSLKEGNTIEIINKNHVIIRNDNELIKELRGEKIGIFIFK